MEWKNNKILRVTWINVIDLVIVLLFYSVAALWITVNFGLGSTNGTKIDFPINNEADFQKYVNLARYTHYYKLMYCLLLVFLVFRWIKILTDKFPSFGALFQTISVAAKDLINIIISIFILLFGFLAM